MKLLFLLPILIHVVLLAPLKTQPSCSGCIEEPCPLARPSCPASCNSSGATGVFDVEYGAGIATVHPSPNLEGDQQNTLQLLPTLDEREVHEIQNDILEIAADRTRNAAEISVNRWEEDTSVKRLHRISNRTRNDMDRKLTSKSDEVSNPIESSGLVTHGGKYSLEEGAKITEINTSLHSTPLTRGNRVRRADIDNCNDEKLRKLIRDNIKTDAKTSKRNIQKAANEEFGGHFNVICSPCEFSFVVASQKYCDGFKEDVVCFAFLQPPTNLKLDDE